MALTQPGSSTQGNKPPNLNRSLKDFFRVTKASTKSDSTVKPVASSCKETTIVIKYEDAWDASARRLNETPSVQSPCPVGKFHLLVDVVVSGH